MNSMYDMIRGNILEILKDGKMTPDQIKEKIVEFRKILGAMYPDEQLDEEALYQDIKGSNSVTEGDITALDNNAGHEEWLSDKKSEIDWNLWKRYEKYLKSVEKLPPKVVASIDASSDEVLRRIENPERPGNWDRRGMVVGNVQSGKTSNYIGVISKAVDAGYKIIIILAGLNNDLRSQTQKRVDKGFLGRDTSKKDSYNQTSSKIGVGLLPGFKDRPMIAVTSSDANGDFKKSVHNAVTITPGGDPIIAVVKKNVTPLNNLYNWFQSANEAGIISGVPLLLIDDEADNASIDTNTSKRITGYAEEEDKEKDPTKINGLIRKILNSFTQSAYVGYTATPFANIFIYPNKKEEDEGEFGEDLYPRSFILNLEAPSNYIGPEKVFGLYADKFARTDNSEGLPLVQKIHDYIQYFPDKHKSDLTVLGLPDSLIEAIYSFILSCAARCVRGQEKKHNSMLIHVTRFVAVQKQVQELVDEEMKKIVTVLEMRTGVQYEQVMDGMKAIWEDKFVPITDKVMAQVDDNGITPIQWHQIEPLLYKCASKIEVKAVNGKAADGGLKYDDYPNGCYVIAIGGDKLSRGLTLEGLTVSYYTRASKMYDTLLQMGRWFGYRDGYVDLCRLYTSGVLANWYKHIAVTNLELRNELNDMAALNATPEEYGLKVRMHPDGMLITALNKMRNSAEREVTYAAKLVQTTRFYRESAVNQKNYKMTEQWIKSLGTPSEKCRQFRNNYVWQHIKPKKIVDFLNQYAAHHTLFNADPKIIGRYIMGQTEDNELIDWTVALINVASSNYKCTFADLDIGLPWRTDAGSDREDNTIYLIRNNLITEMDQSIDLSEEELKNAYKETLEQFRPSRRSPNPPDHASPVYVRRNRKKTKGLLLIYIFKSGTSSDVLNTDQDQVYPGCYVGFAVSFPDSNTAKPVKYKVDEIYMRNSYDAE